MTFGDRCE